MRLSTTAFLFCLVLLSGCGLGIKTVVTKSYPPLAGSQEIRVLNVSDPAPSKAEVVGTVRIFDNMTMKCDSATVFAAAKEEARKSGGNVLKITEHLYPSIASSCHRIEALILKVGDFSDSAFTYAAKASERAIPGKTKKQHGWRGALNGGWSWRTAKTAGGLNAFQEDYISKLKSGNQFGAEVHYFTSEGFGIGATYSLYHSYYSTLASAQLSNGQTVNGTLSDNINITYVAPSVYWRIMSPTKMNAFLFGLSIGYMGYSDEGNFLTPSKITGSTVGLSYDLSYDLGLSKHLALGFGASWRIGALSSITVSQDGNTKEISLDKDNKEGISHIGLLLGLRFR